MIKYAGIKDNNILIISDKLFTSNDYNIVEIPEEFSHLSSTDLITNFKFKNGKFKSKLVNKSFKDYKIAFVTNWKMSCGISTYSEALYSEMIKKCGDYKLFIEKNNNPTSPVNFINDEFVSNDKIIECWKRGDSLKELIEEIKKYDPDIILIQHEFGIWPNARYWLSLMNQLHEFRVITTMHSVFHHKDKIICEAAMSEIVVHLEGAKEVLKNEKMISGNVYVIPHGSFPCTDRTKLWNFYRSQNTFMQFGFGFRYKGWESCIYAVAILKEKYPDIFFTGLFSESEFNKTEHQLYYNELMNLVSKLKLEENISIVRGFQSDIVINSYLRTNQATVFPYTSNIDHEVFGASGAARLAMSKGLPVITSSVNHFMDLPTIKANTPEEIAKSLDLLFSNQKFKENQILKQIDYINETSWEKIAEKYINLIENKTI